MINNYNHDIVIVDIDAPSKPAQGDTKWLSAVASLAPALAPQGAFFAAIDFAGTEAVQLQGMEWMLMDVNGFIICKHQVIK